MDVPSPARSILFVGSVPLGSAAEVFRVVAGTLGDVTPRIPDGETGERLNWIAWTRAHLRSLPALEPIGRRGEPRPRLRVKDRAQAIDPRHVDLGPLQYAPAAIRSYAEFRQLKAAGRMPEATRFQVSLPTPFAIVFGLFPDDDFRLLWPLYEARMRDEIDAIAQAVPARELAIQWDVAVETIEVLEAPDNPLRLTADDVAGSIARVSDAIPDEIELGFHICYGDRDHRHFIEPRDLDVAVAFANRLAATIARPIGWVHMPVPRERHDDAYFAPLQHLTLRAGTQLYLGLVHLSDGAQGTRQRMAAAERFVSGYGIATECGLGRRPVETVPPLLSLFRELAAPSV